MPLSQYRTQYHASLHTPSQYRTSPSARITADIRRDARRYTEIGGADLVTATTASPPAIKASVFATRASGSWKASAACTAEAHGTGTAQRTALRSVLVQQNARHSPGQYWNCTTHDTPGSSTAQRMVLWSVPGIA
eukprot:851952-Rhodomonas_salina.1